MADEQVQLQVQATPDKACGLYSNASIVSTNGAESRIDFLYVDHANKQNGSVPAHLVSRVIMPTSELARLSETLNSHIAKHLEKGL